MAIEDRVFRLAKVQTGIDLRNRQYPAKEADRL